MQSRNVLAQILTNNYPNYIKFGQLGVPCFQGACFSEAKTRKWLVSEAHGLYTPTFFCQTKIVIVGGSFKYGLPDALSEMAFQT